MNNLFEILELNGLTLQMLNELSYKSQLGISLKRDLRYFDISLLKDELQKIVSWYDEQTVLHDLALDYRIKSYQSAIMKLEKYFPDNQMRKTFDDMLGFRCLCDSYNVLAFCKEKQIRIANMTNGKANDDGYRGVHIYFQKSGLHYPIEIQFNTFYDRQFNNWLHKFIYKKNYSSDIGKILRYNYEKGLIRNEECFKEKLEDVLRNC